MSLQKFRQEFEPLIALEPPPLHIVVPGGEHGPNGDAAEGHAVKPESR